LLFGTALECFASMGRWPGFQREMVLRKLLWSVKQLRTTALQLQNSRLSKLTAFKSAPIPAIACAATITLSVNVKIKIGKYQGR
jgi:hypothetical protein